MTVFLPLPSDRAVEPGDEAEDPSISNPLYEAICANDWNRAKSIIDLNPGILDQPITASRKRALHVAALLGHLTIVEELLRLVTPQSLETEDAFGNTPLSYATITGVTQVAKLLVKKNPQILSHPAFSIAGAAGDALFNFHATMAFQNGHQEMGCYLYHATPLELLDERGAHDPFLHGLLRCCLQTQRFDVALDLLRRYPQLLSAPSKGKMSSKESVVLSDEFEAWRPIYGIATMNSAIPSLNELVFWKRWIYNGMKIPSTTYTNHIRVPIQEEDESESAQAETGQGLLQWLISYTYNLIGIDKIRELKLLHTQAAEILRLVCEYAKKTNNLNLLAVSLLLAAKEGNVDFILQVSKANPEILLIGNPSCQNLFYHAVKHRQAKVFNLIHGLRFKDAVATSIDIDTNTLLHVAATQALDTVLNRIDGPALQMQSELQWFKGVENLIPLIYREARNNDGMTATELFKESHKELMKQAEEWVRATASSSSVVGALIATIVFAAGFTVPGGNDQNFGYPLFIKQPFLKVFVFSNTLSLISSTTSVLMFLAILTSRYSEEKFLYSLPTNLVVGLSSLFISVVTMTVAFLSAIHLMLKHTNYSRSLIPIIILASVPIVLFVLSHLPLLLHFILSTYWSIFNRKVKLWP